VANAQEVEAMRLAIALSAHGLGTTSPNPPVGCVILDASGQIVGTGYHHRKGEPHAEALALAAAGRRAAGGTAVVTLEPCNHVGRTPACRQALLDAGIARVVVGIIDPTSRREGGAAVLRAAGVDVEVGVLAHEARLVLGPWLAALATGRPVVIAAYVVSDDANELLDRQVLAELRVSADAVLHQDSRVDEGVPGSHGQGILELPSEPVPGAPANVLKALYVAGVRTLLLDGGVNLIHEYAAAGLVDRAMAYVPSGSEPLLSSSSPSAGVVPAGFSIERVTKTGRYVRLDAVPRTRG
jgi:diaminohydroxyphosphoribosylaminopyrimidine deaminase / 5-amino-6-(5-phosphoribosylamino)uracil reductase